MAGAPISRQRRPLFSLWRCCSGLLWLAGPCGAALRQAQHRPRHGARERPCQALNKLGIVPETGQGMKADQLKVATSAFSTFEGGIRGEALWTTHSLSSIFRRVSEGGPRALNLVDLGSLPSPLGCCQGRHVLLER